MQRTLIVGALFVTLGVPALGSEQPSGSGSAGASLATVTLKRRVLADGKPLNPGTYLVRLGQDELMPAAGQSPGAERVVEFVKGSAVAGREVATVIQGVDRATVLKGKGPGPGASRVDLLKGDDYVRVWINSGGTHYLINLPTT